MLKSLIDFAIERRVTIVMFTVAVALFGFVSLSRLKLNLLPDLSYPTITIRTELPGAAPLELETLITRPVEESVSIIRNVREVRSVSRAGQSDVTLEFLWGTDMDIAGIDVREKLDLLQLPIEAKRPLLLRFDPASEPVMRLALMDQGAATGADSIERLKSLRRFAEDRLKPDLEAVEGSAAVKVSGGYEDEVQVFVDQQKLAQLGLSIDVVTRRIRAENVNLSGGRLEQGTQRFLVRTLNEFESVEQMANAIIATRDGRPVYLRDVASVTRGYKDREAITRVNGRESIELAVYKEGDANTVALANGVRERIRELEESLPEGTRLQQVYDQSTFIAAAISEVKTSALIGGVLAILVLYAFLRDARATLISSIAIPVSVLGTFVLMYAFDITLNIMSLGGIALAVGMLVDNAVVVLESIVRNHEQGMTRVEAARRGTAEVATAVFAATLTSVAVFAPMIFITGIAGQLFKDQSLTVAFALSFSLLVALTLVPMLAAGRARTAAAAATADVETKPLGRVGRGLRVVRDGFARVGGLISSGCKLALSPLVNATQAVNRWADRSYPGAITWALAHPGRVIGSAIAVFVLTMVLVLPRLGTELIPQMSQGEFNVDLRLPPGTPLEQTDRSVQAAQRASDALGNVALAYSVAGTGNRLDANPVDAGENTGRLSITLQAGAGREDEEAAMAGMRQGLEEMPGLQYRFSRPALFSMATPLEVVVSGYDLDRLGEAAERVRLEMLKDDRFADVKTTVEAGNPEIQIVFDQERATQLNLVVRDIANRVVNSVRGEVATRYKLRDKQIDVLVRSVDSRAASIEEVRNLIVNPGADFPVPLSAVADVKLAMGPAEVRRVGQERVAVISANLAHGDLGSAVTALDGIVNQVELPVGTTAFLSGQSEEMTASFKSLQFVLVLAIFLVYLVMASQFESLIHPFVILLTIPLALIGAVWALWLTGTTVNVVAYIGLIMLAGIVVNQSIVLIDAVNQLRAAGMSKFEAIVEGGKLRLRPILITKLTTILGLLPMALGIGEGAEVRAPMAITVIGGVLLTTFLTLLVIPVVYSVLDRKQFVARQPQAAAPGPSPQKPPAEDLPPMLHTQVALSRPVTTIMAALALLAVGLISGKLLPLEAMPDISFPGMQIIVPYAGSTPEEMEELVVRPVEEALATLSGIKEIRASAQSDQATFTVLFDWDRDVDAAAFEVRTKLDSIRPQLPVGADRLLMFAFSSGDQPVAVIRISSDKDLTDQYEMLEKYLQRPIERIEGVARVELQGVQPREVRILVEPTRLAAYSVDVRQLRTLLEQSNFSVSAGEITENNSRFTVRPIGEFRSIDDVRNLLLSPGVRLGDIAQVDLVSPELPVGRRMEGRPAVGIDVFKATQANVVDVADRVLEAIEKARDLPQFQGIKILVVGNQADSIRESLRELRKAGMIGAVLSFFMLLFFLRHLPTTLIVSVAVPASLLVTLAAMYFMGFTLNVLTMMGMLLAIGMLVDNSVVITESIFRHRQLHPGHPLESTLAGVKEVGVATLAGTFSMIIVFLPLVFGERNQMSIFLVHVAVPIIVAMLASLVIAQTLLPMLAARMSPPPPVQDGSWFGRLQLRYGNALNWALTHRKWMALITALIVVSPVPLFMLKLTKVDPFPQEASRVLMINYHLEGSHPMQRVEQAVQRVEAYVAANRERFDIDTFYSYWQNDQANTRLYLMPKDEARVPATKVMELVMADMPEIIIGKPSFTFDDSMSGSSSFSLQLAGESTERLADISREVAHRLSSVPGLEAVRSEAGTGEQEVQVIVNRDRASQLGLTTQDIALTVAGAMRGDRLPELRTSEREITMRLAFRESDRQSVEDLARVPVMLPDGSRTDLGAVAEFVVMPSDREIQRLNRLTTVVIDANLAEGTTMDEVRKRVEPVMAAYALPAGYTWKFGRGFEENDKAIQTMSQNMLLAVVLIFLVMASLFESALYPLSIITSIVFAIVGSIWFLTLTGTTITMMAMIGFMVLMGVVVNIGIVLIAHVIDLRQAGMPRHEAILQAGHDRLRPIMMTTLTTLLGMLPLAIGDAQVGGGGEGPAYHPLARAIIGGLAFSAIVSLIIVPVFYVWFDDLNLWRKRVFTRARPAVDIPPTGSPQAGPGT